MAVLLFSLSFSSCVVDIFEETLHFRILSIFSEFGFRFIRVWIGEAVDIVVATLVTTDTAAEGHFESSFQFFITSVTGGGVVVTTRCIGGGGAGGTGVGTIGVVVGLVVTTTIGLFLVFIFGISIPIRLILIQSRTTLK